MVVSAKFKTDADAVINSLSYIIQHNVLTIELEFLQTHRCTDVGLEMQAY